LDKAIELYKDSPIWNASLADILDHESKISRRINSGNREYYVPFFAYLHYYGIGVEKDIKKSKAILGLRSSTISWRNFYSGCMVPKDFEFAVYILENSDEIWASGALADIYEGKYLPEHADAQKAEYWRKISNEKWNEIFKDICAQDAEFLSEYEKTNKGDFRKVAFLYGAKTRTFRRSFKYENVTFKNPFYDWDKFLTQIDKIKVYENKNPKWYYSRFNSIYNYSWYHCYLPKGRADNKFLDYIKELSAKYKALAESSETQK
jgi:hypothetical protein